MSDAPSPSPRRAELLERAYTYALAHGLSDLSLRPLAAAIGSSPRVLIFLFGSKDGLTRALLAKAREDELALLSELDVAMGADLAVEDVGLRIWTWLRAPAHRPLLTLWVEAYARSVGDPAGPWAGFAAGTVADWLTILGTGRGDRKRRTATLAVLRGALLDLLATGDERRTSAAVRTALTALKGAPLTGR